MIWLLIMINNKKINSIVTELFLLGKLLIKETFDKLHLIIHQTLTLKISFRSLKNVLQNHILFLVNDTTLPSDNPLRFRKKSFKINIY